MGSRAADIHGRKGRHRPETQGPTRPSQAKHLAQQRTQNHKTKCPRRSFECEKRALALFAKRPTPARLVLGPTETTPLNPTARPPPPSAPQLLKGAALVRTLGGRVEARHSNQGPLPTFSPVSLGIRTVRESVRTLCLTLTFLPRLLLPPLGTRGWGPDLTSGPVGARPGEPKVLNKNGPNRACGRSAEATQKIEVEFIP